MRKAGTPNPMTGAGKVEHSLVAQTIEEMIGPRLTAEVCVLAELLMAVQTIINLLETVLIFVEKKNAGRFSVHYKMTYLTLKAPNKYCGR